MINGLDGIEFDLETKHFKWDEETGEWIETEKKGGRSRYVDSIGGWVHVDDFPKATRKEGANIKRHEDLKMKNLPDGFNDILLDIKSKSGSGCTIQTK